MERWPVGIVVVLVAAVALFGIRLISERTDSAGVSTPAYESAAGGVAAEGPGSLEGERFAARRGAGAVRGRGRRSSGKGDSRRQWAGRANRAGGAAEVAVTGQVSRESFVGQGSGHAGGVGAPSRHASISGGVGGRGLGERKTARSLEEFDLPPASITDLAEDPFYGGADELTEEGEEGELFSLAAAEDGIDRDEAGLDEEIPQLEKDVERREDGQGMVFTEDSVLAFPTEGNVRGEGGTIAFKIEPNWNGSDPTDNALVQIEKPNRWQNRIKIVKNREHIRYMFFSDLGGERNINVHIKDWKAGEPHEITATWGDALMKLYIDGRLAGQATYEGGFQADGAKIYVGSRGGGTYSGLNGTLSNLTIHGSALSPGQVGF